MQPQLESVPEPFDPAEATKELNALVKELDDLETDITVRPLHNFMQDRLMPLVATLQTEISTLTFYLAAHEDRIVDLEEQDESRLIPEDAQPLLAYLARTVEIFEHLLKKTDLKLPGMEEMVAAGKDMMRFVEQITLDEEES